ncbi:hypothetical protein PMI09_05380 [Rhizobium sp. CF122]|nr:hypothetical protein PMI09_05380 [Rhizobium sp. CF122]
MECSPADAMTVHPFCRSRPATKLIHEVHQITDCNPDNLNLTQSLVL